MDEELPWLSFAPSGWKRRFIGFLVRLGVAHEVLKRPLKWLWLIGNPGTVADISRDGCRWRLDISNNHTDRRLLFVSPEPDGEEIRALLKVCGAGWFIDVGANIGYYSIRMAGMGVRTLALEPHPVLYRRMLYNMRLNELNDKIVALPIGAGPEGEADLLFFDRNFGAGSMVNPRPGLHKQVIHLSPLASILQDQGIQSVDALKVDVEGMEDRVLIPFFEQAPKEHWPRCLTVEDEHADRWQTDVVEFLGTLGYRVSSRTRLNLIAHRQVQAPRELGQGRAGYKRRKGAVHRT